MLLGEQVSGEYRETWRLRHFKASVTQVNVLSGLLVLTIIPLIQKGVALCTFPGTFFSYLLLQVQMRWYQAWRRKDWASGHLQAGVLTVEAASHSPLPPPFDMTQTFLQARTHAT